MARKFEFEYSLQDYNPLICVAFHPSGYYIAAGFTDQIRLFHLLHTELRIYKEVNKKVCELLRFSNGGSYLAAACRKLKTNTYEIYIYNSYSLAKISKLKGHSKKVTDMIWSKRDLYLYSCGEDGIVNEWYSLNWTKKDI